jgi:hypothetical protein
LWAHGIRGIQEHGEGEPRGGDEGGDDLCPLDIDGDGEDLEVFLAVVLVEGLHGWHFDPAWVAPGRPEVEQDHLAMQVREAERVAVQVGERKVERKGRR